MSKKKKKRKIPLPLLPEGVTVVDTHCHLDMEPLAQECGSVIERAVVSGVTRMITIGIDFESSKKAVDLAAAYEGVYAAVGVHPHNVRDVTDNHYRELIKLAGRTEVVAWGEIGMDLFKQYEPPKLQKEHFLRQIKIAKDVALPLIIHDREAHSDVLAGLLEYAPFPAGGVMHCFSGDAELAARVIDLGFYVSIPGVVTFNKAELLQDAVRQVPLSRLLLETDAPFLAPSPKRGKSNEPAFVLYTAQKVAELKGVTLEEVARKTTLNAKALFGFTSLNFAL
ncbi:MAG: TatD family hydrolase [Thermodesulfobacteriota bacterium]|nr:TatD family hydrolase [Thermodesulfobacteriota bacterium]